MPAAILPGQHYATPSEKRVRVENVIGTVVHGVFVSPGGIACRGDDSRVMYSVDFVQRWCEPIDSPGSTIGAVVARGFGFAA